MESRIFTLDEICRLTNEDPAELSNDTSDNIHFQMKQMNNQLNKMIVNQQKAETIIDECLLKNSHSIQHNITPKIQPSNQLLNFAGKILDICQEEGLLQHLSSRQGLISPQFNQSQTKVFQHQPQKIDTLLKENDMDSIRSQLKKKYQDIETKIYYCDNLLRSGSTDQLEEFRLSQTNVGKLNFRSSDWKHQNRIEFDNKQSTQTQITQTLSTVDSLIELSGSVIEEKQEYNQICHMQESINKNNNFTLLSEANGTLDEQVFNQIEAQEKQHAQQGNQCKQNKLITQEKQALKYIQSNQQKIIKILSHKEIKIPIIPSSQKQQNQNQIIKNQQTSRKDNKLARAKSTDRQIKNIFNIQPSEFNMQRIFQNHGLTNPKKQQNEQLFTAFQFVRSKSKNSNFISNQAEGDLVQARALSRINEQKFNTEVKELNQDLQQMKQNQVDDMMRKRRQGLKQK
ncbi:hypothetical protein SS50377_22320 [Spironucleus salmonicida]|uniref:Uncharacterized protein n=1 Tax=Spironucleus salmonicida TaxID=348837 RepID=V6LET7_9EUKA|nr:hypothetical protein SS50377_22320 [Spironucleus salmonicida]|eukprot:EST42186.1 Hypothetical protein SS50377_18491 [Spironucleus salmonicida]